MKKKILITLVIGALTVSLTACTEASIVSHNMSHQADNFNVIRRLTVLNARSDKPIFELTGAFSFTVDPVDDQLEVTCETEEGQYKKHVIGLNESTMYIVEDISDSTFTNTNED